MRRRVWCGVVQLDALSSFLAGLPSMIRSVDHDTAEPRSLYDWELTKDMVDLLPSRPPSCETPIAYFIAKSRILRALGGIVDFLSSLRPDSYDVVLALDEKLSQAHLQVPPHLQLNTLANSRDDHPSLISRRLQLEFLYHQGMCVLHRKFMARGRLDSRFLLSHNRCIESAVVLLSLQDVLHKEAKTRGPVRASHLYHVSLTSQDFILAAIILCLELRRRNRDGATKCQGISRTTTSQENTILQGLETSYNIWKELQMDSAEAWKVYRVLSNMFQMLGVGEGGASSTPTGVGVFSSDSGQYFLGFENGSALDGERVPHTMDFDWVSLHDHMKKPLYVAFYAGFC